MKSEKAKKFLETKQPGDIAQYEVSLWKAERTAEIAEAEMRERAIEAYRKVCIYKENKQKCRFYGSICKKQTKCSEIEIFIQQLDKQK